MEYKDYYKLLGIKPDASTDEIRKAYLKKNNENHPDKLGISENSDVWKIANEYIQDLNKAYKILSDPELKNKYDEEYFFERTKSNSDQNQKNQQFTHSEGKNKPPIKFNYNKVSPELKEKIKNRQDKEFLYKIRTKSAILSIIGLILSSTWFLILYSLSDSSRWTDETRFMYYLISAIIAIVFIRFLSFITKWKKCDIKWNLLVTPLYFIITEFEIIRYYYLWELKNVKATNNYRNGFYQNTTANLEIGDITYNTSFRTEKEYNGFVSLIQGLIRDANIHLNNNNYSYFINNDELVNLKLPEIEEKQDNNIIKYVASIFLALLFTFVFDNVNANISSKPHYISNTNTYSNSDNSAYGNNEELKKNNEIKNEFNETELPFPYNGKIIYHTKARALAPLEIKIASEDYYYVKIENYYNSNTVAVIFIRPYQSIDVNIPLGSYTIKYATGKKWYGEKFLFGPYTKYYKASERFDFEFNGNQYLGYTLELYLQTNGNLQTETISPSEF